MVPRRTKPTIHDVAREAGVSATTVSHAFSGKGVVASGTRDRIEAAAKDLGYRPDVLAQSLRNNRLRVLALVLRPLSTLDPPLPDGVDYFLRFAGSAAITAMEYGYGLMLVSDPLQEDSPSAALACDGFLITEPVTNDPLIQMLLDSGVPFLSVGKDPGRTDYDSWLDTETAMITADVLDHLRDAGATTIALLTGTDANSWNYDTEASYRDWCRQHGQSPLIARRPESLGQTGGRLAADELFDSDNPPDGIYCLTGRHAAGFAEQVLRNGLSVPDDVLIVCGSDSEHVRSASPPITAIDLCPDLLARTAVGLLINRLDETELSVPTDIRGRLRVRESTRRQS